MLVVPEKKNELNPKRAKNADTRLVIEHLQDYNLHFVRKDIREKVLV